MLNQVVLVGRLKDEIEWLDEQNAILTLAVSRPTKDENGEYGTDMVKVKIVGQMANNTAEYCHKGDIIGIKGRIQSDTFLLEQKLNLLKEYEKELESEDVIPEYEEDFYQRVKMGIKETIETLEKLKEKNGNAIIAEKATFLSSHKQEDNDEE